MGVEGLEHVVEEVVGQRAGGLHALERERDRGGLSPTDEDGKDPSES